MKRQNGTGEGPGSGSPKTYPYGEMLKCPVCGKSLIRRKCAVQNRGMVWCCDNGLNTESHFALWERFITDSVLKAYREVDVKQVGRLKGKAAERMMRYKLENPELKQVDYYWLDDLVESIEIGGHTNMPTDIRRHGLVDDRTIRVVWKCRLASTVFSGTERDKDNPYYVAELHNAYLERKGLLVSENAG